MAQRGVALLKSPSTEDDEEDPYFKILTARGYAPQFIPVLEHGFTNEDALDRILQDGSAGHYSGVIVTSGRSVEAWAASAQRVARSAKSATYGMVDAIRLSCSLSKRSTRLGHSAVLRGRSNHR